MTMSQDELLNIIRDTSKPIPDDVLKSPNMTIELIREMVTVRGNKIPCYYWSTLTTNQSITWEIISSNPDLPWCHPCFVHNKNFSWDIVHQNPQINWKSCNTVNSWYITWDEIITNLELISDPNNDETWKYLSQRYDLDVNYVLANIDKPWNWYYIGHHEDITGEIIEANPDLPWDPYSVMYKACNWEFIKPYVERELESRCMLFSRFECEYDDITDDVYDAIAKNPNITWDIIRNDPLLYSELGRISSHSKAITWDIVRENIHLDWNWSMITRRDEITMEIVKEHLDAPWDWWTISNEKASLNDINEHPEYPWHWDEIYWRSDLTEDFKHANLYKRCNWRLARESSTKPKAL